MNAIIRIFKLITWLEGDCLFLSPTIYKSEKWSRKSDQAGHL